MKARISAFCAAATPAAQAYPYPRRGSLITLAPEIDKLVMRDLEVNLITNKVGVTNWDDLLQPSSPASGESTAAAQEGDAGTKSDFEIKGAFGGLDLENIKLLWLDEQAGSKFEVIDLDLGTGRIEPNKPFPLTLHLDASASGVQLNF